MPKRVPKYEAESKKEAESKEKVSSATPEGENLEKYKLASQELNRKGQAV